MPKSLKISESIVINAPLDVVWNVSANQFEHIDRWDGNVRSSRATGAPFGGAPVGGRVCSMYNGSETVEALVSFDDEQRSFVYEIKKGLPGFVVSARNTWQHSGAAAGKTHLSMTVDLEVKGILGTLMRGPMKSQMGKVLRNAQQELKHYAETGNPHPRKQKKLKSKQKT
ncbi:MAG: SRPBCC family protein [Pseudomonadota bacterium]